MGALQPVCIAPCTVNFEFYQTVSDREITNMKVIDFKKLSSCQQKVRLKFLKFKFHK